MHKSTFDNFFFFYKFCCFICAGAGSVPVALNAPRQSTGEDSAGAEDAVLVVDDNDGSRLYNKYGPNQYTERDVMVPSRPQTASSEGRRLTPAE